MDRGSRKGSGDGTIGNGEASTRDRCASIGGSARTGGAGLACASGSGVDLARSAAGIAVVDRVDLHPIAQLVALQVQELGGAALVPAGGFGGAHDERPL